MTIRDAEGAARKAAQLARNIANGQNKRLRELRSSSDVETAIAKSIARGRRFEGAVAPELHARGIYERAIREHVIEPVAARIGAERAPNVEEEDRLAIREDGANYREAPPPRPAAPSPVKEKTRTKKPARPARDPTADDDLRRTGNALLGVGLFAAIMMGLLAAQYVRGDRVHQRALTVYVASTCVITESHDDPGEGGMSDHHLRFRLEIGGKTYMGNRYSPDVDTGPGAAWMPVDRVVDCYYDPDDPSMVFLFRGNEKKETDPMNYLYLGVLPALLLGMGVFMRFFAARAFR